MNDDPRGVIREGSSFMRFYVSCALVDAFLEIAQHVITGAHGEGDDWHGGGFVSTVRKNA